MKKLILSLIILSVTSLSYADYDDVRTPGINEGAIGKYDDVRTPDINEGAISNW